MKTTQLIERAQPKCKKICLLLLLLLPLLLLLMVVVVVVVVVVMVLLLVVLVALQIIKRLACLHWVESTLEG